MSHISIIVGERIKKQRNQLGLTQEELAERCGLHHTYIGQLERGEKNATLESIAKVVVGLNTSFELFFEKLTPDSEAKPSIAAECYDLIDALTPNEQRAMWEIITKAIEYKTL